MNASITFPDELIEAIAVRVAEMVGASQVSPLMTVDEAASYLRCKPKRIYDLTSQGRLGCIKDGSRTLIRQSAIDNYLESETT